MDRQNYEAEDRFPLSTQALTFMQDMVMATAQLALIGGDNYILSGCTVSGKNVSDGIIVINGEIMPFKGGVAVNTITIVEETIPVSANGITFKNARVKRYAKFASGTGANYFPWVLFKPLQTNKQLQAAKATIKYVDDEIAKIQAGSIPTGVIVMWGGREADIPQGWCLCDGRTLSDNTRVPDLRGRFIVGYNSTTGSGYTRISAGDKKTDNYNITIEMDNLPTHGHPFKNYYYIEDTPDTTGADGYVDIPSNWRGSGDSDNKNSKILYKNCVTDKVGANKAIDIRPPYYVLAFIIKIDVKK